MPNLSPHITAVLLFALVGATPLRAQDKAIKLMEQHRYADAASAFEKHLRKHKEDGTAYEHLGSAYQHLRDFHKAESSYERADLYGSLTAKGYVNYGQVLVKNGKPNEARKQFEQYLKNEPESFVVRLMMQSLREVEAWTHIPHAYEVRTVAGINSEFSDFAPVVFGRGLAFTTERNLDHVNENTSGESNMPYLAVFHAEFKDPHGQDFKHPKNFLTRLYGDYHVGPIGIDTVHQEVFYTEVGRTESKHMEMYVAPIIKGKKLGKATRLTVTETEGASVAHPALTPDGNTLFFVSDKAGGMGGMDIYVMTRTTGGWSEPSALTGVNTELNEVFPYAKAADHLYFSSNGHSGYGGLDLFETRLVEGHWTKPINLKSPINGTGDDFGITFHSQNRGYFSSEREGGSGRDDIYQFIKLTDPEDQNRVTVNGVFEYVNLPRDGVKLRLLDEEDNLLEETQTDSVGKFVFTQIPVDKNYHIEAVDVPQEDLKDARAFLLNEDGQKVAVLERLGESKFVFKSLPREEYNSMALMEEEDTGLGTYDIFGQLYSTLPTEGVSGMKLVIMDDEGNLVDEVLTDSLGIYTFSKLSKTEHYTVKLVDKDSVLRYSSVYYEDANGVKAVSDSSNSLFNLERLIAARLAATAQNPVHTQGYVEYEGRPLNNVRLMLVDSASTNMRATRTDQHGHFDFGRLTGNSEFSIILPESIAKLPGNTVIYLINEHGERVVYAKQQGEKRYVFRSLMTDEYSSTMLTASNANQPQFRIYGQVFQKLPGDYHNGLTIVALDDDGRVIETAVADKDGNFKFTKLRPDQRYTFNVSEQDHGSLQVNIYDNTGAFVDRLRLDELSAYVYQKLSSEDASMFAMREDDNSRLKEELVSGMVYKKLPGDYKEGILVYAVDEKGNILDSAYTDTQGKFKFAKLDKQEDFILKVADKDDSGMMVGLYDRYEGKFDGLVTLDETNAFKYNKIVLDAASELGSMDETDQSAGLVRGQVYNKLPGDYEAGMKVYAYDAEGNIIDEAITDSEGRFAFKKLSTDGAYTIRMADESDNATLTLFEAPPTPKPTPKPVPKPKPQKPLPVISAQETIYYAHKERKLTPDDSLIVEAILASIRADGGRYLRIESHTDPSEMEGQTSYSALRSVGIVRYLVDNGLGTDRLFVQNWESDRPAVDCGNRPCTAEDRAKNQRSVLSIVDKTGMPTPPDHVITYDFNQWLLPADGQNAVYRTVKYLKENPEVEVVLDGYADTWGSYTANQRVSKLRTENVKNTLLTKGIEEERIRIVWHGESIPLGGCLTAYPCPTEHRKQNRRVEIRFVK